LLLDSQAFAGGKVDIAEPRRSKPLAFQHVRLE
jgi:hypothetical protein